VKRISVVKKFLITVWGNPWIVYSSSDKHVKYRWERVKYVYRDLMLEREYRTTLPILLEALKPEETLIVVPETVTYELISDYKELRNHTYKIYKEFVEKICEIRSNRVNIAVLPSSGRYVNRYIDENGVERSLRVEVYGSPLNYMYAFALNVGSVLEELLIESSRTGISTLEVYLDISHGVNFMPVSARAVLQSLLSAIGTFMDVKLAVLNSEPVIGESVGEVSILEIEDREPLIPEQLSFTGLKDLKLNQATSTPEFLLRPFKEAIKTTDEEREIIEKTSEVFFTKIVPKDKLSDLLAFAAALQYLLPLWIFYFKFQLSEVEAGRPILTLKNCLENLFEKFTKVEVKEKSNSSTLQIMHKASIGESALDIVKVFLALHTLTAIGYEGAEEVVLGELKLEKLKHKKMPGIFKHYTHRIGYDVGDIVSKIVTLCKRGVLPCEKKIYVLKEIILKTTREEKQEKDLDKACEYTEREPKKLARHLAAHSGLEHCTVEIVLETSPKNENIAEKEVKVRPRSDKIEFVKKTLETELL